MNEKQKEILERIAGSVKKMSPELQEKFADKAEGAAEAIEFIKSHQ